MKNKKKIIAEIKLNIKNIVNQPGFKKINSPIFKLGNEIGILIIPGFDNTAFLMKEYAEFLNKKGYTVYALTLPGRGVSLEKFAKTTWQEWVNFVIENYLTFKKLVKKVFIAGFSTGATIALYLNEFLKKKELSDGIILLSPALFILNRLFPLSLEINLFKIFAFFNPFPKKLKNRHLIFRDPDARKKYDILGRSCSNAVIELFKMAKIVRANINKVSTPFLAIQSKKDIVVCPYSAEWLSKKVKTKNKKIFILNESGHPVMVDLEKNKVFEESYKFIKTILG